MQAFKSDTLNKIDALCESDSMNLYTYPFKLATVTSRLFTHIVSTEKIHKDVRYRKDMRVTKYTYFDIASN